MSVFEKIELIRKLVVNLDAIKCINCDSRNDWETIEKTIELLKEYEGLLFQSDEE